MIGEFLESYVCYKEGKLGLAEFHSYFKGDNAKDNIDVSLAHHMRLGYALYLEASYGYRYIKACDLPDPDFYVVIRHDRSGLSYYSGSRGSMEFSVLACATRYWMRSDALCRKHMCSYLDSGSSYRIMPVWQYGTLEQPCGYADSCEGRCEYALRVR